jgi:hypothetical protein
MNMRRTIAACALILGVLPAVAHAQSGRPRVAIGLAAGLSVPSDDDAASELSFGPLFRFGEDERGWGPAIGLGWFSTVLDGSLGAANGEYVRVTVRPVMAGIAHTWHADRWSYEAAITAGYSFNSVDLLDAGQGIFPGASTVVVEISNSFALRPRVRAWYDITDRVSWMIGTGITFTKPELTFRAGSNSLTRELGGAAWQLDSGIAVRIF